MALIRRISLILLTCLGSAAQTWIAETAGTTASFRGIGAVNARVVWASGTGGTYIRTADGGATWIAAKVSGAEALDFRDLHAADERTVYLLSIGAGDSSRVYKTTDAGANWKLMFTNPDAKGFFDAIAFWDAAHGVLGGDAVDGHIVVFTTSDGGEHWLRRATPPAIAGEGAFAASGTCLIVRGTREAWFATGGAGAARVYRSTDGGINYNKPAEAGRNIAITSDGGATWTAPASGPKGFRSAVAYAGNKTWIVTGTSGSDISRDDGRTWTQFDTAAYNAIGFIDPKTGWAVGPKGAVARFRP
jgi:photosystem II stability/assembly factor-like uncharacterized protein